MRRIIYNIIKTVYPERCGFCGRIISPGRWICSECAGEIELIDSCGDVPDRLLGASFDKVFYAGRYGGLERDGLLRLKRHKAFNVARFFCTQLAKSIIESGCADDIDYIAYVPMSKRKKAIAGYDHAEVIAKLLSRRLEKKLLGGNIRRKSTRKTQHAQANYESRKVFAERIYLPAKKHIDLSGKTILICDDIITSGSSLSSCAKILKEQGAKAVYAAALVSGK